MYSEFLGDWTRKFPREQLLILRNEDYKKAQREHMDALFKFLGGCRNMHVAWLERAEHEHTTEAAHQFVLFRFLGGCCPDVHLIGLWVPACCSKSRSWAISL
jgi:hypothetical protein